MRADAIFRGVKWATHGLIHGNVHIWPEDGRLIASGGSNMLHIARSG